MPCRCAISLSFTDTIVGLIHGAFDTSRSTSSIFNVCVLLAVVRAALRCRERELGEHERTVSPASSNSTSDEYRMFWVEESKYSTFLDVRLKPKKMPVIGALWSLSGRLVRGGRARSGHPNVLMYPRFGCRFVISSYGDCRSSPWGVALWVWR